MPVGRDSSMDFQAFLAGALAAGSTPNGVFGARIMWGTMEVLVDGLDPAGTRQSDLDLLTDAFGSVRFVHLRRGDVVSQAVSWARAEQTGRWQRGDVGSAVPTFDVEQIDALVRTIREHERAWAAWFAAQRVDAIEVDYDQLVADPRRTVERICVRLGVSLPQGWVPDSPHRKQADDLNAEWVRRYAEHRSAPGNDPARSRGGDARRRAHASYGPPTPLDPAG